MASAGCCKKRSSNRSMSCCSSSSFSLSGISQITSFSINGMAGISTSSVARRNRVFISATVTVVITAFMKVK